MNGFDYTSVLRKHNYVTPVEGERKAYAYKICFTIEEGPDWFEIIKDLNKNSDNFSSVWDNLI